VESSDNKLQVIKLSAIRSSDTEWIQTTYGLISNFTDPATSDVGKLYNFSLDTTLTSTGILVAYATDNVSQFESYRITGFYTAIGTNPPAPVLPPAYNFDSTWLNNSSLESIYITGNPS
jgi:predicted membrane-bound spermidine synthase